MAGNLFKNRNWMRAQNFLFPVWYWLNDAVVQERAGVIMYCCDGILFINICNDVVVLETPFCRCLCLTSQGDYLGKSRGDDWSRCCPLLVSKLCTSVTVVGTILYTFVIFFYCWFCSNSTRQQLINCVVFIVLQYWCKWNTCFWWKTFQLILWFWRKQGRMCDLCVSVPNVGNSGKKSPTPPPIL